MPAGMSWDHETVETLKRMWSEDKTCGQIAAEIDKTRSAVAGMARRLNLERRDNPIPAGPRGRRPRRHRRLDDFAIALADSAGEPHDGNVAEIAERMGLPRLLGYSLLQQLCAEIGPTQCI